MEFDFSELASIIRLNSHTRHKHGVDHNGQIVTNWMKALGYDCQVFAREAIGDHLYFTSPQTGAQRLLLLGHLDTVYPKGSFVEFEEDADWIYGPGVCDMKGGYYAAICALRAVYAEYGALSNIDLLLVSDEETGSDDSKHVTLELAPRYNACLVFEAAGKAGELVIGRKGVATFQLEISGKAAHAGNHYSDGVNANLAAAKLIVDLTALTDLAAGSTVNVGKISGGIGANTISPQASLLLEMRYTSQQERDRLLGSLDRMLEHPPLEGITLSLSGGIQRDVMEPSAEQARLLKTLEQLTGYRFPTEQRGGVSDANVVSAAGVPTLDGFGPFGDGDHTVHERASKQSFVERVALLQKILAAYSQDKLPPG